MFEEISDISFLVPSGASSRDCSPCRACTSVMVVNDNFLEDQFESCMIDLSHEDTVGVIFPISRTTLVIEDSDCESDKACLGAG